MSTLLKSGIAPLDERLGGIIPNRAYVLTGAPGSGKSIACLEFLHASLEEGGTAALLTHDDPSDVLDQGGYLGLDLATPLAEERLVIIRYQLDFARKFARTADPAVAFAELTRLLGERTPQRIAVDSISPIVEAGAASGACVTALLDFLEQLQVTALLTHPGDLASRFDRRLEALTRRAAAIFHLSVARDRTGTLEIQKIRYPVASTMPISFVIRPGIGIVTAGDGLARRANDIPSDTQRKLLVLTQQNSFPAELLKALRGRFDVAVRERAESAFAQLAQSSVGAVLINVRRDSMNDALALVRELRLGGSRSPIAFVTEFTLRSNDRARALRAGADDFFMALHPAEFLLRAESLVQRGRSTAIVTPEPALAATEGTDGSRVLDETTFKSVVQTHADDDVLAFFTLLRLKPFNGGPDAAGALATLAAQQIRAEGGDLVGRVDGSVAVLLNSARRKDVEPFIHRIRDAWRATAHAELDVTTAAFPSEEAEVRAILDAQRV